jgi:hypothetical protein
MHLILLQIKLLVNLNELILGLSFQLIHGNHKLNFYFGIDISLNFVTLIEFFRLNKSFFLNFITNGKFKYDSFLFLKKYSFEFFNKGNCLVNVQPVNEIAKITSNPKNHQVVYV